MYGNVYEIQEEDALEWISKKLNQLQITGELEKQQNVLKEKARQRIYRPKPVMNLKKTIKSRTFTHDLTIVVPEDILDADGQIIYAKGMTINPLKNMNSQKALLFFDGDDSEQVQWALKEYYRRDQLAKLILINGSIIDLMQQTEIRFYFDQSGRLIQHFQIEQIPAVVEQKGEKLIVSELKLS